MEQRAQECLKIEQNCLTIAVTPGDENSNVVQDRLQVNGKWLSIQNRLSLAIKRSSESAKLGKRFINFSKVYNHGDVYNFSSW